jgi:hypothetical protein
MGVCSTDLKSSTGCVEWDPDMFEDGFVFYCNFCVLPRKIPMVV